MTGEKRDLGQALNRLAAERVGRELYKNFHGALDLALSKARDMKFDPAATLGLIVMPLMEQCRAKINALEVAPTDVDTSFDVEAIFQRLKKQSSKKKRKDQAA